jgi:phosphatidylinositol 3-kinase
MVEAMGGAGSEHYTKFQQLCCEAFNILRRPSASNLILNLLLLMVDANVQHLKSEQDVAFVTERFQLSMNNEEASRYFLDILRESVNALFTQVVEIIHIAAQAMRS